MEGKALKSFLISLALVWGCAYAAVAAPPPPAAASPCKTPWLETHYLARSNGAAFESLELRIGNRADGTHATLSRGDACLGVCEVRPAWRPHQPRPDSITLKCANPGLDTLTAQAVVLWKGNEASRPLLRFGNWIDGYRDFALAIEVDRYSDGIMGRRLVAAGFTPRD